MDRAPLFCTARSGRQLCCAEENLGGCDRVEALLVGLRRTFPTAATTCGKLPILSLFCDTANHKNTDRYRLPAKVCPAYLDESGRPCLPCMAFLRKPWREMTMRKFVFVAGALALVSMSGTALADGSRGRMAYAPTAYNWSGVYFGGHLG